MREIKVGKKPRISVAMDYVDLLYEEKRKYKVRVPYKRGPSTHFKDEERTSYFSVDVIEKFESSLLTASDKDPSRKDFHFTIELYEKVKDLTVKEAYLFAMKSEKDWASVKLESSGSNRLTIAEKDLDVFIKQIFVTKYFQEQNRNTFIAIKFNKPSGNEYADYDYDDYWTFEVKIKMKSESNLNGNKYYIIRSAEESEFPHLKERQNLEKYK